MTVKTEMREGSTSSNNCDDVHHVVNRSSAPHPGGVDRPISLRRKLFACVVFVILGMTNFYSYSAVLNAANSIQTYIYPDQQGFADSVTALIMTADFCAIAVLSFTGVPKMCVTFGLVIMAIGALALLLVTQLQPGRTGAIIFKVFCFFIGGGSALSAAASFSLANSFRLSLFPTVLSSGGGLTGVLSFAMWMFLSCFVVHEGGYGVRPASGVMFGMGVAMPCLAFVLLCILMRLSWVNDYLADLPQPLVGSTMDDEPVVVAIEDGKSISPHVENDEGDVKKSGAATTAGSMSTVYMIKSSPSAKCTSTQQQCKEWISVLKCSYPAVLFAFLALFTTYLVFPVIGPNHWSVSIIAKDILTGTFQIGDFSGRFLPAFAHWFPFLIPKIKNAFYVVGLRMIIVISFFLCKYLPEALVFSNFWFQIIQVYLLALAAGWSATVAMIHAPRFISDTDKLLRSKASAVVMLGILSGVSLGQWTSNFLRLI